VPDYGTYPESPGEVAASEGIRARSNAPLVDESDNRADAASKVAQLKEKASEVLGEASARAKELKAEATARASDLKAEAAERAAEIKDQAVAAGNRWMQTAQERGRELSRLARGYSRVAVRDYPLQVIAGAALFGLLCGIGLRVWRERRV
jgi:ElaB/YqjD/DUF883 family membrane-anchored ribosome-binding protein